MPGRPKENFVQGYQVRPGVIAPAAPFSPLFLPGFAPLSLLATSHAEYRQYCLNVQRRLLATDSKPMQDIIRGSSHLNTWHQRLWQALMTAQERSGLLLKGTFVWFSNLLYVHFLPSAKVLSPAAITASSNAMWEGLPHSDNSVHGLGLEEDPFRNYMWAVMEAICDMRSESEYSRFLSTLHARFFTAENLLSLRSFLAECRQQERHQKTELPDPNAGGDSIPVHTLRDANPFLECNVGAEARSALAAAGPQRKDLFDLDETVAPPGLPTPDSSAVLRGRSPRLDVSLSPTQDGAGSEMESVLQESSWGHAPSYQKRFAFPLRSVKPIRSASAARMHASVQEASPDSPIPVPKRNLRRPSARKDKSLVYQPSSAVPLVGREVCLPSPAMLCPLLCPLPIRSCEKKTQERKNSFLGQNLHWVTVPFLPSITWGPRMPPVPRPTNDFCNLLPRHRERGQPLKGPSGTWKRRDAQIKGRQRRPVCSGSYGNEVHGPWMARGMSHTLGPDTTWCVPARRLSSFRVQGSGCVQSHQQDQGCLQ